jgi:hypothetical protein
MAAYTLQFTPEQGPEYEICYQAVALSSKQIPVGEWDDVVSLLEALKGVGTEAKEKAGNVALYELREYGGKIELDKAELKLLLDFIRQPMWRPHVLPQVQQTVKWLEGAQKKQDEERKKPALVEDKSA